MEIILTFLKTVNGIVVYIHFCLGCFGVGGGQEDLIWRSRLRVPKRSSSGVSFYVKEACAKDQPTCNNNSYTSSRLNMRLWVIRKNAAGLPTPFMWAKYGHI